MLGAICGLIVAVLLRILVEYLSGEFTFLAAAVPWMTWIVIGVAVFVGVLMVIRIVKEIRRLIESGKTGGKEK